MNDLTNPQQKHQKRIREFNKLTESLNSKLITITLVMIAILIGGIGI